MVLHGATDLLEVVEWHRPDRLLQQFDFRQHLAQPCDTRVALHDIDRRGRVAATGWALRQATWIEMWDQRRHHLVTGVPEHVSMHDDDAYLVWYRGITRRFVTPPWEPAYFHPSRPMMNEMVCASTPFLSVSNLFAKLTNVFSLCRFGSWPASMIDANGRSTARPRVWGDTRRSTTC